VADPERLRQLARSTGVSRVELVRYVELEVLTISEAPLRPDELRRLRRIRRLRRDLGLSVDAVAIILRLLDRIDALEGRREPEAGPPAIS
jgi:DNA-binding transcriptional MerR regulator